MKAITSTPHIALLLLGAFASPTCVFAQIASDGSLPGKNKFDKVEVVTALPSDNEIRKRSLVAKRIYGRDELERFGDENLSGVLSNLPGVQVVNGAPSLSGLDAKYTKILFNGTPAPTPLNMDQINPSLIDRIEIIRGQTASSSSQSIGGTINIVFKDIPKTAQKSIRYGGSYQNQRPTPSATYTFSENSGGFSYNLPLSVQEQLQTFQLNSLNTVENANKTIDSAYQERSWWFNYGAISFSPKLTYVVNDDEKFSSQSFMLKSKRKIAHAYQSTIISGTPTLYDDFESGTETQIFRTNLEWTKNLSDTDRIESKIGFNSVVSGARNLQSQEQVTRQIRDEERGDTTVFYTANFSTLLTNQHALLVGIDLETKKQREFNSITFLGTAVNPLVNGRSFFGELSTNSLFVQDEWEISKQFAINLGLRSEWIDMKSDVPPSLQSGGNASSRSSQSAQITNPIVHFIYKPKADGKDIIRASVSRGYKAPDISFIGLNPIVNAVYTDTTKPNTATSPDLAGNNNLRPELATGIDASYEKYFGSNGLVSIGGFYREVDDILNDVLTLQPVYWATVPRWVSQPVNFSHGRSYGLEFELRGAAADLLPASIVPKNSLTLRLNLNYYGSNVDAVPGPNNRFASQYPWTATLGFDYKAFEGLTLGASYFLSPEYTRQKTTTESFEQSDLRWINGYAQYKIDNTSSMRIGLNNLFPSTNRTGSFATGADRINNRSGRTSITVTIDKKL